MPKKQDPHNILGIPPVGTGSNASQEYKDLDLESEADFLQDLELGTNHDPNEDFAPAPDEVLEDTDSAHKDPKMSARGLVKQMPHHKQMKLMEYSEGVGEFIADMMIEQEKPWREIAKLEGMPSVYQMQVWYDESPEFKEVMDRADRVLARACLEDVLETADDYRELHKDQVPSERLWFEKKKFLAEKLDAKRFGANHAAPNSGSKINIVMPFDYKEKVDISEIVDENEIRNITKDDYTESEDFDEFRGENNE